MSNVKKLPGQPSTTGNRHYDGMNTPNRVAVWHGSESAFPEIPECPENLSGPAAKYFHDHAKIMHADGRLNPDTWESFIMLCSAFGHWQRCSELHEQAIDENPELMGVLTKKGGIDPLAEHLLKAHKHFEYQLRQFMEKVGPGAPEDDGYWDD